MGSFYLSKRKTKDGAIRLYAVENVWNFEKRKQDKKQTYIGCKHEDGTYAFNERTAQFLFLLRGTEFERRFYQWQDWQKAQKAESDTSDPEVEKVVDCTDLSSGTSLLLTHVADKVGLVGKLNAVFGETLTDKLLSLAYFCAQGSRQPLYTAAKWSEDQKLPGDIHLSERDISEVLGSISASQILEFLTLWIKGTPVDNRLSLDITSISSYSKGNPDVMFGYNRDHEKLPQINLLFIVDQETKLPVWFEQLPGAISDMTTVKDTTQMLDQIGVKRKIVCDRGFSCNENIACLQKHGFKFTMGVALHCFPDIIEKLDQAKQANEFCMPGLTHEMFDTGDVLPTQGITKIIKKNGHRLYLHLYYCPSYKSGNDADLMEHVDRVAQMLEQGKSPVSKLDREIAEKCFSTHKYKGRIIVHCDANAVAAMKEEHGGYFAIISNQIKDCQEALRVYKLRDGVEKRFDDLKNEEDCQRLRVHSAARMRARLFVQFLAQILRCYILNQRQTRLDVWKTYKQMPKTVSDIIRAVAAMRYIHIEGHHPFYKRPTRVQLNLFRFFGIDTSSRLWWPSLRKFTG